MKPRRAVVFAEGPQREHRGLVERIGTNFNRM